MKYIRTKDGIHELMFPDDEQQMSFDNKTIEPAYYTTKNDWVAKKDVIAQADTIEELGDYWDFFDSIYNEYKTKEIYYYTLNEMRVSLKNGYARDIKLSIRTCKGLIFVAKMNEKGELELL